MEIIEAPLKEFTLFVREGMVASKCTNMGVSFWLIYDDASTEENPCIVAEGIDENGDAFRQKIFVKDVDPENATYIEMTALETHLNGGKSVSKGMTLNGDLGLNDRFNFVDDYRQYVHLLTRDRWYGYKEYQEYMVDFERKLFEEFHRVI